MIHFHIQYYAFCQSFGWFVVLVALGVCGGILNRMRGGWESQWTQYEDNMCKSADCIKTWGILLHDSVTRYKCTMCCVFFNTFQKNTHTKLRKFAFQKTENKATYA